MLTKGRLINVAFVCVFQFSAWSVSLCHFVINTVLNYSNFFKKLFDFLPGIPEPSSNSFRDPIPSLKSVPILDCAAVPVSFSLIFTVGMNVCCLTFIILAYLKSVISFPTWIFTFFFFPLKWKKE